MICRQHTDQLSIALQCFTPNMLLLGQEEDTQYYSIWWWVHHQGKRQKMTATLNGHPSRLLLKMEESFSIIREELHMILSASQLYCYYMEPLETQQGSFYKTLGNLRRKHSILKMEELKRISSLQSKNPALPCTDEKEEW